VPDDILAAIISGFRQQRLITDYLGPLRPGKEACIHCCRRPDGGFAILKLYTPIARRRFRDDADYAGGTAYIETRQRRAIRRASSYGLECKLALWTGNEVRNARRLRALGLPVPEPLGHLGPAVLMRMIGGPERPAQQLRESGLDAATAAALLPRLQADLRCMLAHGLIHGDLSPYNVLWHRGRHWLIDLPQMVEAGANPAAARLFRRDCAHLLGFLRRCGAEVDPLRWAEEIWARWERGELGHNHGLGLDSGGPGDDDVPA
jgi:RIO kinase 1